MSHPLIHAKYSAKKYGGSYLDYLKIHEWFDETKGWVGHSIHRMFRHHSEGIFEMEKKFGSSMLNSDGKRFYTRYVGEDHVKQDCNGYSPSAKEWVNGIKATIRPMWMIKTIQMDDEGTQLTNLENEKQT